MSLLLSRDDFRNGVLKRDKYTCVVPGCGRKMEDGFHLDAHHIIERRLWPDGGYYLNNGASLCDDVFPDGTPGHHMQAEQTLLSVEDIRQWAGILKPILPDCLYESTSYDKWGNEILPNGQRTRGELFDDESVQKVLKPVLDLFTHYVKPPRTFHLPWSPGIHDDDKVMTDLSFFEGKEVIGFLKLDGENTSLYRDHIHARSVDSKNHESRTWAKTLHGMIAHNIPQGWRVSAENMYAKHSIKYKGLRSYLYGFGVWNEKNIRLPWDECVEWFALLNSDIEGTNFHIEPCPYFYRGIWNREAIEKAWRIFRNEEILKQQEHEGYVIHYSGAFHFKDYRRAVAKYVRAGHVMTTKHWMHGQAVEPNELVK